MKTEEPMQEPLYQLIMEGTVQAGLNRNEVVTRLSAVFKQDPAIVEKLLSGKPRVVKKDLDLATARRYQGIIERAGAVVRVEPSTAEALPTPAPEEPPAPEAPGIRCPRCGYEPKSEEDVLLVRGDCPRCGLLVRNADEFRSAGEASESEESEFFSEEDAESDSPERVPATLKRRALASIYTFGCFVLVYWCVILVYLLVVFPIDLILPQIFRWFPQTALANFPMLLTAVSMVVVSFIVPLLHQGRSWGQMKLEIGLL